MKLSAETPPDGDFVRYLEEIERASPAYQSVLAPHTPGAVVASASALADRLRATAAQRGAPLPSRAARVPPRRDDPLAALRESALMRQPAVRAWAGPLLAKLERALADAAGKKS